MSHICVPACNTQHYLNTFNMDTYKTRLKPKHVMARPDKNFFKHIQFTFYVVLNLLHFTPKGIR